MTSLPKLRTLMLFKSELNAEPYLNLFIPHRLRNALAKFRIGNHDLEIERGRHKNLPVNERVCKLCETQGVLTVEDEYHVLLKCPFYNDLRVIYLDLENVPVNMYTFVKIMSSTCSGDIVKLASYLANMFKLRTSLLYSV